MTNIRIARAFRGPRHTVLETIWDTVAEYAREDVRLCVEPNPNAELDHADIFQRMWDKELQQDGRYVLLTEFDFLPLLGDDWLPIAALERSEHAMIGCQAAIRNPRTMALQRFPNEAGGWWCLIDKERAPANLRFRGGRDPCNTLPKQMSCALFRGEDNYPSDFGITYPTGIHLFWSRHYNDDPDRVVSGVRMGDVQWGVDHAIGLWLDEQPVDYLRFVEQRAPELLDYANAE